MRVPPPIPVPRKRAPGSRWRNVTIQIEEPRDVPNLRYLLARYGVRSYGEALRLAMRELAGDTKDREQNT